MLHAKDNVEFTLAPHKFVGKTRDTKQKEEILTTLTIEALGKDLAQCLD